MGEPKRLAVLRQQVKTLPVDEQYRAALLINLERYWEAILKRPEYAHDEGWDDLEALQQVTLAQRMEQSLQHLMARGER